MATQLKNLRITKVDFVDAGANQRANIIICKNDNTAKGGETVDTTDNDKNLATKFFAAVAKAIGIGEDEPPKDNGEIKKSTNRKQKPTIRTKIKFPTHPPRPRRRKKTTPLKE